jgi:carboxyl-terminal processing protease
MSRLHVSLALLATVLAVALGTVGTTLASAGEGQQRAANLETFDAAWTIINDSHWDPDFNGVDWEAVRDELRPQAADAESGSVLRAVISDMIARLGQSHFAIWPPGFLDDSGEVERRRGGVGHLGFATELVDGRFVVARVELGGPGDVAGVESGWIVDVIEGDEVAAVALGDPAAEESGFLRAMAQRSMNQQLSGPPGGSLQITFLDGDDAPRQVDVGLVRPEGVLSRFGNMPALFADLQSEVMAVDVGFEVGVIGFNIWLPLLARPFAEAVDTMRDAGGIVLDLRGNPGGIGGMVMGIGGYFVAEEVALGTMRMRNSELNFVANPRRIDSQGNVVEPYAGPLAILVDSTTGSTSEVFAGGLQAIGRARVFGERSMGAVLPSLMDELPNGDILQHAVADFIVTATDVRLEGRGVVPDEHVAVTRTDLLAGRDPVLDAALKWIAQQQQ